MTTYYPCIRCPRGPQYKLGTYQRQEPCPIKAAVRKRVGAGDITIVRFKCPIYTVLFRISQRVKIRLYHLVPASGDFEETYSAGDWDGVIVGKSCAQRDKWIVFLDDGWKEKGYQLKNEKGVVSVYANRITPLDEPDCPDRVIELERRDVALDGVMFA